MPVVGSGAKLRMAVLPASSRIVPPLSSTSELTSIPSASRSTPSDPTSYSNTRMVVPLPPGT